MNTRAAWQSPYGFHPAPSGQVAGISTLLPPNWARVQGALTTAASGTTANLAFSAPVAPGNIVVGAILEVSGQIPISVTDDKGNAYAFVNSGYQVDATHTNDNSVTGFFSVGPMANGPQTLTFTYQSTTIVWILIEEFRAGISLSGISIDGSQLLINSHTLTTPNFQTLRSSDLLWSCAFAASALTTGAGWTTGQGNGTQQLSQWQQGGAPSNTLAAAWATGGAGAIWATVFGVAAAARTRWAQRQNQIQRSAVSTTTGSISFPNPVASGSIVIGTISVDNLANLTSLVDDKGNSYTVISPNQHGRAMFWSNGVLSNGPITITATVSVSSSLIFFIVNEFVPPPGTSVFAVDGTPTATTAAGSGTSWTSGSVTTTINGDLLYTVADMFGGLSTPANGFSSLNGQGMTWSDAFLIQQTAGTVASQWTSGSNPSGNNMLGLMAISAS